MGQVPAPVNRIENLYMAPLKLFLIAKVNVLKMKKKIYAQYDKFLIRPTFYVILNQLQRLLFIILLSVFSKCSKFFQMVQMF